MTATGKVTATVSITIIAGTGTETAITTGIATIAMTATIITIVTTATGTSWFRNVA
jgi:hypothetical protein